MMAVSDNIVHVPQILAFSMNPALLDRLRCPETGSRLIFSSLGDEGEEKENGWLTTLDGNLRYPVLRGVPRFVPTNNYADNFGMQWNHFAKTQLDSHSGHPISAERFWASTGWTVGSYRDCWILDVGCGSGRFAEVALATGANVVALDYSSAVDACQENLKQHPNLHVVQGDVFQLPFEVRSFDCIYSLGVLQHTPNVEAAFAALPPMLAPGGRLCVDYYEKSLRALLHSKYILRPLTKRLPQQFLFKALQLIVPFLLPISQVLGRIPIVGIALKRLIPVANDDDNLPLTPEQLKEWSLLDTFDWLGPEFDNPQTASTAYRWMEAAHLKDIEVFYAGHLVARAVK